MQDTLTVIVEFGDHNLSAFVKEVDGIFVTAEKIAKLKASVAESIDLYIETCKEIGTELPEVLKHDFHLVYKFDLSSFINAYAGILSKSGLEVITGINQKQLWHYANGNSKPRKQTIEKVSESIRNFGKELAGIEFV